MLKMANKISDLSPTLQKEQQIFGEVIRHNDLGFNETKRRTTGRGRVGSISFDEADELFRSWIDETNWPYDALIFDPRVFTFINEKTSRLIAGKPKGYLTPREESDVLSAKINNSLLDYQWDQANYGGTMLSKWAMMDMNARKYGASFALCKWRYETSPDGKKCLFDGPEMELLPNRDFAHDLTATSIEDAHWVQVRQYVALQDLENINDVNSGKPIYKNLPQLKQAIAAENSNKDGVPSISTGDSRSTNWSSRNRAISRIEVDPYGKDDVYKDIEIVTEYRKDRWITFAPRHGVVLRDIENPYQNNEIPVVMLKYYPIDDDLYGLSEIEPVKGLQKAINAILCQYIDEINQNLYSPIAVGPGVRMHTLEWGKGARWQMNNPMTDFRLIESRSNAAAYFNNTYSVLVSAMMNTLGESSLGVSNIQPYQNDKTATEVKALQLQRNARDNQNQICLADAIKRQTKLWHTMNQVLLFSDPNKQNYIIRVAGKDGVSFFSNAGLDAMDIADGAESLALEQNLTDIEQLKQFLTPRYPVNTGTKKEPKYVAKFSPEENGASGMLYVEPSDINGNFDFTIDVETMAANSDDQKRNARQTAVQLLVSNPNVLMMLGQEGVKPKFKDLFVTWLEDLGFNDADKYFEGAKAQGEMPGMPGAGGPPQAGPEAKVPTPTPDPGVAGQLDGIVNKQIMGQPMTNQNLGQPNPQMMQELIQKIAQGGANNGIQQ